MRKLKTNLINYCISHEYINFLDSLDLNIVGSGAFKKNIQNIGSMTLTEKIYQKRINIMEH